MLTVTLTAFRLLDDKSECALWNHVVEWKWFSWINNIQWFNDHFEKHNSMRVFSSSSSSLFFHLCFDFSSLFLSFVALVFLGEKKQQCSNGWDAVGFLWFIWWTICTDGVYPLPYWLIVRLTRLTDISSKDEMKLYVFQWQKEPIYKTISLNK